MAIPAVPPPYDTLVLIILLVAAFVLAFRVMEMVFETLLVSALSAVFYGVYTYIFYSSVPKLNNVILFAFLGASLYMGYHFLESAYRVVSLAVKVPVKIFGWIMIPVKKSYRWLKSEIHDYRKTDPVPGPASNDEKDVKEVVLDKVKDED